MLFLCADFFENNSFSKHILQEYHQSVKEFCSSSGQTFPQALGPGDQQTIQVLSLAGNKSTQGSVLYSAVIPWIWI